MATLKDLQQLMEQSGISADTVTLIITEMRRSFPGEKIYIQAPDTSKKQAVIEAAKRLPTCVVVERYGVTRQYVSKLIRRKP